MYIDPRPFRESKDWVDTHEEIAEKSRVSPAIRANGDPGVLINYGRSFAVLGAGDAIKFATLIADIVDEAKGMTKKQ